MCVCVESGTEPGYIKHVVCKVTLIEGVPNSLLTVYIYICVCVESGTEPGYIKHVVCKVTLIEGVPNSLLTVYIYICVCVCGKRH